MAFTALALLSQGALAGLDLAASRAVGQAHPGELVRAVNRLATLQVWTPFVLLIGALLWLRSRRREGAMLVLADLSAEVVTFAIKLLLASLLPLPQSADNGARWVQLVAAYPFPSGHVVRVTVALAILTAVLARENRRARLPVALVAVGFTSLLSVSRMIAAAHTLSQVAGGCLLGLAWVDLTLLAARREAP